jgi:protein-tyrosine phosphatase
LNEAVRFVDLHVHLLPGLDDGPGAPDESIALCRALVDQGVELAAATCHQRGAFSRNHADAVREATRALARSLDEAGVPLKVVPSAEWMLDADAVERLDSCRSQLLTVADNGQFALVEFPFQVPPYVSMVVQTLRRWGVQPVLAHVEHYPQLLHAPQRVRELIDLGFLIQMNADSIARPRSDPKASACRRLVQRGLVHLAASDAHGVARRPPALKAAFDVVAGWTNPSTARLLFRDNPLAIVEGGAVAAPAPAGWLARLRRT